MCFICRLADAGPGESLDIETQETGSHSASTASDEEAEQQKEHNFYNFINGSMVIAAALC